MACETKLRVFETDCKSVGFHLTVAESTHLSFFFIAVLGYKLNPCTFFSFLDVDFKGRISVRISYTISFREESEAWFLSTDLQIKNNVRANSREGCVIGHRTQLTMIA